VRGSHRRRSFRGSAWKTSTVRASIVGYGEDRSNLKKRQTTKTGRCCKKNTKGADYWRGGPWKPR